MTQPQDYMRQLIKNASEKREGVPPPVAMMGFGTWTQAVADLLDQWPIPEPKKGYPPILFFEGVMIIPDPFLPEGEVHFVMGDFDMVKVQRFNHLDYVTI